MATQARPTTEEPIWFRERGTAFDYQAAVVAAVLGADMRREMRAEMVAEALAYFDLVQRDDWSLRDCEAASASIVRMADGITRIRASINRDRAIQ